MDPAEKNFRAALAAAPGDEAARLAFSDWLEERGRREEAARQQARTGACYVYYALRQKSTGRLVSRPFSQKSSLHGHVTRAREDVSYDWPRRAVRRRWRPAYPGRTGPVVWDDLEVVACRVGRDVVAVTPLPPGRA